MKPLVPILLMLCSARAIAEEWRPDDRLLAAVRHVESSNGRFVYGDDGVSLGDFQICLAAWKDVTTWRRARGLPVYSYHRHVFNSKINRLYAADYLTIIHSHLRKKLRRNPTVGELYAGYNMGLAGFALCNFQLSRVNRTTLRKCQFIRRMAQDPTLPRPK